MQAKNKGVTTRNGYTLTHKRKGRYKDMTINEAYDWIWENTNLMQDTLMLDFQCLDYCVKHGILKKIDKEHFESTWTD